MKVKPGRNRGKVIVEVGAGESKLLSNEMEATGSRFHIQRILVPIDFSDRSKKALRYAVSFARQFQASIFCLHVLDVPYGAGEMGIIVEMEAFKKGLDQASKQQMDKLLAKEIPDTVPSDSTICFGTPYREIVRTADAQDVDLIIMGTHGHTGLSRVFLGSTTERVVRHAHCPVLVVREREREFISAKAEKQNAGRGNKTARSSSKRILQRSRL